MNLKTSLISTALLAVCLTVGLSAWASQSAKSRQAYQEASDMRERAWDQYVASTQTPEDAAIVRNLSLDVKRCRPEDTATGDTVETVRALEASDMACLEELKKSAAYQGSDRTMVLIDWVKQTSRHSS